MPKNLPKHFIRIFQTIKLFSVPLKLPTQPLPPQQQPSQVQQQTKTNNLDVLAQTLKLSDLDFDFEPSEPVRLVGGSSQIPPEETQVGKGFFHCFWIRIKYFNPGTKTGRLETFERL